MRLRDFPDIPRRHRHFHSVQSLHIPVWITPSKAKTEDLPHNTPKQNRRQYTEHCFRTKIPILMRKQCSAPLPPTNTHPSNRKPLCCSDSFTLKQAGKRITPRPLSELPLKKSSSPTKPPQRARVYARVRRFSFFAFTSSPVEDNQLMDNPLRVKASPQFPSPVKD